MAGRVGPLAAPSVAASTASATGKLVALLKAARPAAVVRASRAAATNYNHRHGAVQRAGGLWHTLQAAAAAARSL